MYYTLLIYITLEKRIYLGNIYIDDSFPVERVANEIPERTNIPPETYL